MVYLLQLITAVVLDGMLGDPAGYPHPVRIIGKLIEFSERLTRTLFRNLYLAGFTTVCLVLTCTGILVWGLLSLCATVSVFLSHTVAIVLIYMSFAARDLLLHSLAVAKELAVEDSLVSARREVAKIVGRDTSSLDRDGICRACIETVAENMVDGITAPIFWAVAASCISVILSLSPIECSALGVLLYKAVNTMDSMIGYKNDKYLQFGRTAAKLDDMVNYIPARISGFCLIIAAFFLKLDYRNAARIFFRDRNKHASPNAGHTEATVAGALNIQLGGPLQYFNKQVDKSYLGDDIRAVKVKDIKYTNSLVIVGSIIFFLFAVLIRAILV